MSLRLPVRQYIAVPSGAPQGLVTDLWELPLAQTAFIELHCWNVGITGGVPAPDDYWVFMGSRQNHERMERVVAEQIAPALQAARAAGMTVVHVQPESVAARYPEMRPAALPEEVRTLSPARRRVPPCPGGHPTARAERVHGAGYRNWDGWPHLDVAPLIHPVPGETMIATTDEFHAWLSDRGIHTLIYTGFCTNLCILDSPAAMRAMANLGYRCVLLREATLAVEFADQPPTLHTDAALRYIESWIGYTAGVPDFVRAAADVS